LARRRGLIHLGFRWQDGVLDDLRVIGRNLVSLVLREMSVDGIDGVVEYCPNLQYLQVRFGERMFAGRDDEVKHKLKDGLKRLAKLKVNGASVCLGTVWEGY
jgi:hypothetical protein